MSYASKQRQILLIGMYLLTWLLPLLALPVCWVVLSRQILNEYLQCGNNVLVASVDPTNKSNCTSPSL